MPKYTYKCNSCDVVQISHHGMKVRIRDCGHCDEKNSLQRVLTKINLQSEEHAGTIVKKFIEDTREEIELAKQERDND